MAKVDLHVLPFLCVLYLMAFLDRFVLFSPVGSSQCGINRLMADFVNRVNISNAVLFGLQQDLDIQTGTKYNTALTIFFVPYIIFEVPDPYISRGFSELMMRIDPIKHTAKKTQAACLVVVLYGNVWFRYGHAGAGTELGWFDGYSLLSGFV